MDGIRPFYDTLSEVLLLPKLPKYVEGEQPTDVKYKMNVKSEDAPAYMRHPYIMKGYRVGGDHWRCLQSLFELHNETLNAWTMVISSAASCVLLAYVLKTLPWGWDILPFAVLTFSAVIHMPFSVANHTFIPISYETYTFWKLLDLDFIFVASSFMSFSLSYFVFPIWAVILNVAITVAVSFCSIRSFHMNVHKLSPENPMYPRQVQMVGCAVACYWFPMFSIILQELWELRLGTPSFFAGGAIASLVVGAYVFATGWPQKHAPGSLDFFMNSHQLMHWTLLSAHLCEYAFLYCLYLQQVP
jgi:adiponectin receptor